MTISVNVNHLSLYKKKSSDKINSTLGFYKDSKTYMEWISTFFCPFIIFHFFFYIFNFDICVLLATDARGYHGAWQKTLDPGAHFTSVNT